MSAYKDKKTGKWCAHVRYTDWQGEARRKLKRGFKTKREALAWEREFLASASGDLTMTLGEFVRAYEEDRRPRLKLNTWITKDYIIKDKILPHFANKPMNEIGPRDIVKWQNAVMREGGEVGDAVLPDLPQDHTEPAHRHLLPCGTTGSRSTRRRRRGAWG